MNSDPPASRPLPSQKGATARVAVLHRLLPVAVRVRAWLVPVVLLAALYGFARLLEPQFPIEHWFFWRYLVYWGVALVWMASCFSCGHAIIKRVLRSPLPVLEQVTMNFAVGVLAFFMLMFFGGLARLYGPVFFVALPLLMIASGARPSFVYLRRLRRGLRATRARSARRVSLLATSLWCLGLIALFLFYIPTIVPSKIGWDSSWYHVPIGEHYARLGRIDRFPEGWYLGAIPHLPSLVFCYGFLLPFGNLFHYVEQAAHLEFASLLMMLPGIPALVRRLAPRARAHVSWIAFFAFPSIFWYDQLIGGDQISALWPVPICLALLRTVPRLSWRHGLLLACGIAGETLTKYSASGILAGPALAVGACMVGLAAKELWLRRSFKAAGNAIWGGVTTGAAVLLLTTPVWAKNWIWYGDPFFPLLHRFFASRPWSADASTYYRDYILSMADSQPPPGWEGVRQAFFRMFNHSFKSTDFSQGPLRGAMFTLMCACIPFVRAPARLWGMAVLLHLSLMLWYLQMFQDRYLVAYMPAMAAVAVATAVLAWRTSLAAKVSVFALFSFHTVWSLSMFALGAPNAQYRAVLDFTQAAANNSPDAGMGNLARFDHAGKAMPKDALVLVHGMALHAGLGHPSVNDWTRVQAGISYGRLDSPAAVNRQLRALGITNLLWEQNWSDDSVSGDLRFLEFATRYCTPQSVDGLWVGTMPKVAPPGPSPEAQLIAYLSCNDNYAPGLYAFSSMTVPNPRGIAQPPYPSPLEAVTPATQNAALDRAYYAVFKRNCGFNEAAITKREFERIGQRSSDTLALYARKAGH